MERTASQSRLLRGIFNRLSPGRVEVTGGFLLLAAWLNYLDRQGIVPLALLSCALHELGHLLVLRLLGVRVRRLSITAVGAEMETDRSLSYGGEILAALAGPLVKSGPGSDVLPVLLGLGVCRAESGAVLLQPAAGGALTVGGCSGAFWPGCWGPEAAWRAGWWLDRLLAGALAALGLVLVGAGAGPTLLLTAAWLCSNLLREANFEGKRKPLRRRKRRRGEAA